MTQRHLLAVVIAVAAGAMIFLLYPSEPAPLVWHPHDWKEFSVAFDMPGKPRPRDEEITALPRIKTQAKGLDLALANPAARFYVLTYTLADGPKKLDQTLDFLCVSILQQMDGRKPAVKNIKLAAHPGRELGFTYQDDDRDHRHQGRLYYIEGRFFYVAATMPVESFDEPLARKFLDSFRVQGS